MLELTTGPGVCGEVEDIEQELCSSSREVSVGYVPFVDLDMARIMSQVADSRIGLKKLIEGRR
jgi:hypothetical protein